MKRITHLFLFVLLTSGCAVIKEQVPEDVTERRVPDKPQVASILDTTVLFKSKSAIQRSPDHILSTYVEIRDGDYHLTISKEELAELGISDAAYRLYVEKLSGVIHKNSRNHDQK